MTVMITGAGGFIASYLIPELVSEGHDIIAFDIAPRPPVFDKYADKIQWIRGDLSSTADLFRLFIDHHPTHVVHLASILAGPCEADPLRGYTINFMSTAALLDASVRAGVERFVMTSSISVFGKGVAEPVANDAPKNPATVYGQTKLAGEHLMEWYLGRHGLSVCALRFPWVFGPGRERGITALYSSKLLDAIARGEPLTITNPDEKGDWLYVRDATRALRLTLTETGHPAVAYNVMGSVHTIREVVGIAMRFRPDAEVHYEPSGIESSPYPSAYDDSAARAEIGWRPEYDIERAVQEHIVAVESRIRSAERSFQ